MTTPVSVPNFGFGQPTKKEAEANLEADWSAVLQPLHVASIAEIEKIYEVARTHGHRALKNVSIEWAVKQKIKGVRRYQLEKLWHSVKPNSYGLEELTELQAESNQHGERFKPLTAAELLVAPNQSWRIKGVLPAEGIAAIYGASASGKSFLALEAAAAIARGAPFFGHATKVSPVLYVGLEGEGGYGGRVQAWVSHHGQPMPSNVGFLLQPFRLNSPLDVADLAAVCIEVCQQGCTVFIDTLNRAAPGMDENSSRDMSAVIEGAKALQRAICGLVVLIAHTGKDATKGLRGHSSLFAALDGAIVVSREGEVRSWKVDKAKDGKDGLKHGFKLEIVSLGADEDGDEVSSCVVVPDESLETPRRGSHLTDSQRFGLNTFHEAMLQQGSVFDGLNLEAWRLVFYRKNLADSEATKRQAFHRTRKSLVEGGFLTVEGDVYKLGPASADIATARLAKNLSPKHGRDK